MKSIKWKLVMIYLALVFIVMIVSGTFIIVRTRNIEMTNKKSELEISANRIKEQVINKYNEEDFQMQLAEQYANRSALSSQVSANIIDAEGETIATTSAQKVSYKNSDVIMALAGKSSYSYGKMANNENGIRTKWVNYAMPVKFEDTVKYVIFVRMDIASVEENINKTVGTIVTGALLAMIAGGLLGYIFANTLTGPISELTTGARNFAEGNLDMRIEVSSNDEIGQLTQSFNYMAKELDKTLYTISNEKSKLEAVLKSMTDGVLAYNIEGYLIHANPAASEMLSTDGIPMNFEAFVELYEISDDIEKFMKLKQDISIEKIVNLKEKYIKFDIVRYFSDENKVEGTIIVLQDITKQEKLDNMRKEFVANVSHELRTPLTTVKSYAETLMDIDIAENVDMVKEWLGIIDSETDRMTVLVKDLLQLSRLDNKQFELKKQKVKLNEFIKKCYLQHKILAEKKKDNYICDFIEEDLDIEIDTDRISQVMSNIIGNAIKYSPEKSTILIFMEHIDKYVKISVKDNGIGIPKEDLPRIFERFYRVDKARSRAMGGTGLGLAISKEIIELHGGMIKVESEYEKGTTMTVFIPYECNSNVSDM